MESVRRKMIPNPRESASTLSSIFFSWTIPLFLKGYKKDLDIDDVYQPLHCDRSDLLGDRLEITWQKMQEKSKKPSLIMAVLTTFWREYSILAAMCVFNDIVIRLGQPLLLGQFLMYFRDNSDMKYEDALIYASGLTFLYVINTILANQFFLCSLHNGMKVRVAVCSIIYRKALKLSHTALGETSAGKTVNLLSNDVSRFDYVSLFINPMWSAPLLTIIVCILLWHEIGWAGMVGIAIIFVVVLIQSYTGKLAAIFRSKTAVRTDERVRFMDEIVSGVQVIKMYAWEKPFAKLITWARKMELKEVRKTSYIRALYVTFVIFTSRMALFCTMLAITLLYGSDHITAKIFVVSSYFGIIAHAMSQLFVSGITEIAEAVVAFRRLQSFLELDEIEPKSNAGTQNSFKNDDVQQKTQILSTNAVSMKNVTAHWVQPATKNLLQNGTDGLTKTDVPDEMHTPKSAVLNGLNAEFEKRKLIGIIGPVGAGKSSLLQAILRELPVERGSIDIDGTVSYASQESWIFAGTVRQNILFGQEFEKERYEAVVEACALMADIEQLPEGDQTLIGDRGASLSGGQKARVNLARATYRRSDIYLLDDPLSAVDSHVGTHIFNKCLGPKGYLAHLNTTRILATHQVHFLKEADWIIVLQAGKVAAQGTPTELSKRGIDFVTFIESETLSDNPNEPDSSERQISKHISRESSIESAVTNSISSLNRLIITDIKDKDREENPRGVDLEETSKGKVKGSTTMTYYKAVAHWSVHLILFVSFLIVQFLGSYTDIWVSKWVKYEEQKASQSQKLQLEEESSKLGEPSSELTTQFYIYVYGTLMVILFTLALTRSIGFFSLCIRASQKLHDAMLKSIISTKMRFFDTNPSGRVLNRFSKDIGAMDVYLPKVILDAAQGILGILGAIIVTATVNPIFLIPIFIIGLIFIFIGKVYLRTSKNTKRLEGRAKSPVFTHLAATLNGLSTIRAYDTQKILKEEFDYHQDTHSACWYMFVATNAAFGFSLDFMCFVITFCVIYFYMIFDNVASGEKVGLAITQVMSLTGMLQWGVRQSAEISNQMMAVERILEYRDLEPETQPDKPCEVSKDWPENGSIEFRNVIYRYFDEAQPVLRGLSFVIKPKEKIGIVGRTGVGKSSLIGAVFRLACIEGKIIIDGIDTATISLDKLRSNIAIIPQDPVLFSGTLRRNLDPFEEYNDADIWSALEQVKLKDIASGSSGLGSAMLAHGSNFSAGQRQLICLARAILRKNRILALDEATANVDPHTDLLIQQTIREQFANCTVLTVAHRLHTIIDSDRILVMDAGQAIEFDQPHILLQQESGVFKGMVVQLGPTEYMRFAQIALEKYNASQ